MKPTFVRAMDFAASFGMKAPIFLAPMAGACPTSLSIAVSRAGGMGACGVLLMTAEEIGAWVAEFRAGGGGPLQLNVWTRDPAPARKCGA